MKHICNTFAVVWFSTLVCGVHLARLIYIRHFIGVRGWFNMSRYQIYWWTEAYRGLLVVMAFIIAVFVTLYIKEES